MRGRLLASALVLLAALPLSCAASDTVGTIQDGHAYAWGENIGWLNFAPQSSGSYHGLVVTDSAVTGYAWSDAVGWINFNPTNSGQGVRNTSEGHLSGSAWIAARGWLSMDGVTINSSGVFVGTAGTEGSEAGRVSFDCAHCSVVTDWRPASVREPPPQEPPAPPPASQGGGAVGGPLSFGFVALPSVAPTTNAPPAAGVPLSVHSGQPAAAAAAIVPQPSTAPDPIAAFYSDIVQNIPALRADPNHVESYNAPLVVKPTQTGLVVEHAGPAEGVAVEIPRNAADEPITISITAHSSTPGAYGATTLVVGGAVFDVTAATASGVPVHSFHQPLRITLAVPQPLQGRSDVGVYWFDTVAGQWVDVPGVTFNGRTASFYVDHLTRFSILTQRTAEPQKVQAAPQVGWLDLWWLLLLLVLYLLYRWYRARQKRSFS